MAETLAEYQNVQRIPTLASARVESCSDLLHVSVVWSQNNLGTLKSINLAQAMIIDKGNLKVVHKSKVVQSSAEDLVREKLDTRVVVRSGTEKDEQYVELWTPDNMKQIFNLKEIDAHGKIYCDGTFGGLDISDDLGKIVYVAEKKVPKSFSHLYQGKLPEKSSQGNQFSYRQEWGEQLVGKVDPVVAVLDMNEKPSDSIKIIENIPEEYAPGMVKFWNDGIIGVARRTIPRKLGAVYCSNRPCILFFIDKDGEFHKIREFEEGNELGIEALALSPNKKSLVWFERTLFKDGKKIYPGPHMAATRVMKLESPLGDAIEVFSENQPSFSGDYSHCCGIFGPIICTNPWLDDSRLLITCIQGQILSPVIIDIENKSVEVLAKDELNRGVTVLDVSHGYIIGSRSDPSTPHHLVVTRIDTLKFESVFPSTSIADMKWKSLSFLDAESLTGLAVLVYSEKNSKVLVLPHGGPHSSYPSVFRRELVFFNKLGFNILLVNYRGSLGFEEKSVWDLLGNVGDTDVKDCDAALEVYLKEFPASKENVFLFGGSHGGFLVLHLAGQYPDKYKGVVALNPVTNIAGMAGVTDIPDWCSNEAGLRYAWVSPTPAEYSAMFEKSPIAHVTKVKAPVMLLVGSNDLRVPPSQSLEYFHAMQALGKDVRMNMYEDNHPLGKLQHDSDWRINAASFFLQLCGE